MISNMNTFIGHMVVRVIKLIYGGLPVPFQLQEYLTAAPGPSRLQKGRSDSIAVNTKTREHGSQSSRKLKMAPVRLKDRSHFGSRTFWRTK